MPETTLQPRNPLQIVDLIVDELGNPDARAEVARVVEDSFVFFNRYNVSFARAGKATLAQNAKEITDSIAALESKLAAAPVLLQDFLFTPPWARGGVTAPDVLLSVRTAYRHAALEPLRQIRLDCERLLADEAREKEQQPLRRGPEIDRAQRHCATVAYDLMAKFSGRPITSSAEGPYYCIASLLFEALADQVEVDLKRHCDFVRRTRPHLVNPAGDNAKPLKRAGVKSNIANSTSSRA